MGKLKGKMLREDYVILERLIAEYGEEVVINEMKLPKTVVSAVAGAGLMAGSLLGLYHERTKNTETNNKPAIEQIQKKNTNPYGMTDNEYALFKDRVSAVNNEIERILTIQGLSMDALGFDTEYLVLSCDLYGFDIPLLLAQARQESQFGTTPRARRRNSMFSIGAWDNGSNRARYQSQNDAIADYIRIMQEDYLDGGLLSVDEILKDGKFVNFDNKRYASDKNYERKLRNIRNAILKNHPCLSSNINPDTYTPSTKQYI